MILSDKELESKFRNKFTEIYGESVRNDFEKYKHKFENISLKSKDDCIHQLKEYLNREKEMSNFYKKYSNRQYTRFLLITIECYFGKVKNNKLSEGEGNEQKWQVEHIISQKDKKGSGFKHNKLGNLTLLPKKINENECYKRVNCINQKKKIIEKHHEENVLGMEINEIFRTYIIKTDYKGIKKRDYTLKGKIRKIKAEKLFDMIINN